MAAHEIEIQLKWENGVSFEMTEKVDAEDVITVVKLEENGDIGALWEHIATICKESCARRLKTIGDEMAV